MNSTTYYHGENALKVQDYLSAQEYNVPVPVSATTGLSTYSFPVGSSVFTLVYHSFNRSQRNGVAPSANVFAYITGPQNHIDSFENRTGVQRFEVSEQAENLAKLLVADDMPLLYSESVAQKAQSIATKLILQ